jgi:hypothetical protein
MSRRVVQWTTGSVGRRAARAVLRHPDLELVGVFAYGPDKVGRDVGELCGVGTLGITATDDVDALLAALPDCVSYDRWSRRSTSWSASWTPTSTWCRPPGS